MEVREASASYAGLSESQNNMVPVGYKQTEAGVIPEDWEVRPLRAIVDFANGKPHESDVVDQGHYCLITLDSIGIDGRLKLEHKRTNAFDYSLLINDIVAVLSDLAHGDLLGLCDVIPADSTYVLNQRMGRLRLKVEGDPQFIRLQINRYQGHFKKRGQGTSQKHIYRRDFDSLSIPFPEAVEQEAIAEALSDADALIESLQQLIAKKRQIKQGTMQALLTGKQRLPGFSGAWTDVEVKQLVRTPVTDGPHLTPQFLPEGIPFLSVNNLVNNRIDFADLRYISVADHLEFSKKCRPQKNDVLLGKAASVGKVAIVDTDAEFNIWSPIALIRVSSSHDPRFVYYQLQSVELIQQITLLTNSSSQGNIGMGEIERLVLSLPEKDEQTAIATILTDMDTELAELETRLAKTRQLKQGMMQELLTGRIRLL